MHQSSTAPFPALLVRDEAGLYQPASSEQILAAARQVVDVMMQRGANCTDLMATCAFLRAKLGGLGHEVLAVLFVDSQIKLIEYVEMFRGSIDGCEVSFREIIREALQRNAAGIIVAHNHPSGHLEFSSADRVMTARLKDALNFLGLRLHDHILVAGNATASMAVRGLI